MHFDEYQQHAMRTAKKEQSDRDRLLNYALGAAGEAGELAEMVKKHCFHDHELDVKKVMKEVGDQLWYLAGILDVLDQSFTAAAVMNVEKLRRRYPDGFTTDQSHHDSQ